MFLMDLFKPWRKRGILGKVGRYGR